MTAYTSLIASVASQFSSDDIDGVYDAAYDALSRNGVPFGDIIRETQNINAIFDCTDQARSEFEGADCASDVLDSVCRWAFYHDILDAIDRR